MSLPTQNINNSNENTEEHIKILKARKPLNITVEISFKRKVVLERIHSTDGLREKQTAHPGGDCVSIGLSLAADLKMLSNKQVNLLTVGLHL